MPVEEVIVGRWTSLFEAHYLSDSHRAPPRFLAAFPPYIQSRVHSPITNPLKIPVLECSLVSYLSPAIKPGPRHNRSRLDLHRVRPRSDTAYGLHYYMSDFRSHPAQFHYWP